MSESNPCSRTKLAQNSVSIVELCACGVLYVTVGPMTMRLLPEAAYKLSSVLQEAMSSLDVIEAEKKKPHLRLVSGADEEISDASPS